MSSVEDVLKERGTLIYSNVGTSMMPLLRQGKDLFVIRSKGPERCRRGDVVLYRRSPGERSPGNFSPGDHSPGKYVLHRVVEVLEDGYVIRGDNCADRETGITDADILGVMTGYIRDGREHSVEEKAYRDYTAKILREEKSRTARLKLRRKIVRALKRMLGKA